MTDLRFEQCLAAYFAKLSAGDKAGWTDLFAEGAIIHNPVGTPEAVGSEGIAQIWHLLTGPFESIAVEPESVFHSGTGAAAKWSAEGRSERGGKVSFSGITVFEFSEDALIQTAMAYWDPAAMLIALADSESRAGEH